MQKFKVFIICVILILPLAIFARIGAGIGTGKIIIEEPLKAGQIHNLPPLVIFNTGDEPSTYSIGVEYHRDQPELKPALEWFRFEPSSFNLEPGEVQKVTVELTLPLKTEPGDYFAYLEGQATSKKQIAGGVIVGVAAAAKLYFTVTPANLWQAIYYRFLSLWTKYFPWSLIISILIAGAVIIVLFRAFFKKFFKLNIKISKK